MLKIKGELLTYAGALLKIKALLLKIQPPLLNFRGVADFRRRIAEN
jgi:hypothetical protein